jgi:hypothetical protein
MVIPAKLTEFQKPSLIDIHFVEESNSGDSINAGILEEFILKMCQNYEISKNLVDAFVSDGASYNFAAYDKLKVSLQPHLLHIWCINHLLERVGDKVRSLPELKDVKTLLSGLKKLFTKSRARRNLWIAHLTANNVEKPTQICRFGKTRWTSWYQTAFDVLRYYSYLPSFLKKLCEKKIEAEQTMPETQCTDQRQLQSDRDEIIINTRSDGSYE